MDEKNDRFTSWKIFLILLLTKHFQILLRLFFKNVPKRVDIYILINKFRYDFFLIITLTITSTNTIFNKTSVLTLKEKKKKIGRNER